MSITDELHRLGHSARRLNAGAEELNRMIATIDGLLERLMVGLDFLLPRPICERTSYDAVGKRIIEISFLGYLRVGERYGLAVKTSKILESKLAMATEAPGQVVALLDAPRSLRYRAVDHLPELVAGLAAQVEETVGAMERRQRIAEGVVQNLEQIAASLDPSGGGHEEAEPGRRGRSSTMLLGSG